MYSLVFFGTISGIGGIGITESYEFTIRIDNTSAVNSKSFALPLRPDSVYNYSIDWGDSTNIESYSDGNFITHEYLNAGDYTIKISGIFTGHVWFKRGEFPGNYDVEANRNKITSVVKNTIPISSIVGAYFQCSNLTTLGQFDPSTTSSCTNFSDAWFKCSRLTSFPVLDTSNGTNFSFAWSGCSSLTSFPVLNTGNGTNFSYAWSGCSSLTSFPEELNTSNGTNFSFAWFNCSALTLFPEELNTSNGTDFYSAWSYCSGLTSFPVLNTGNGTNFGYAWSGCSGLTSFPLIDTSNSTNFAFAWSGCSNLTSFPDNFFDTLQKETPVTFYKAWESCNSLTAQSVENILVSIAASNVVTNLTGNQNEITITYNALLTGGLSSETTAAISTLKANGWVIVINNITQ